MDIRGFFGARSSAAASKATATSHSSHPPTAKRAEDVFEILSDDTDAGEKKRYFIVL
jgi:hypothetical protein